MPRPVDPPPRAFHGFRVGDCTVDVPLREISAPGARRPLRVTPKSMAVLLVLVEHAGRVVPRDTLIARVWPDTLPTDDVLTQAVTQLRKAFGEKRGSTRYIETIAKSGYRLLPEVEELPGPSVGRGDAAVPSAVPGTLTFSFRSLIACLPGACTRPGIRSVAAGADGVLA